MKLEVRKMKFDDVGSFPLPEGITREWVKENLNTKEYEEMVQRAFAMKLKAGVECPNYPQFRDMNEMFLERIKNPDLQEDAFLIREENAVIRELECLESLNYGGSVRVCITGPFELYYKEFGATIFDDVLENIAESLARFAKNAVRSKLNVDCISLDEPSLGTNPELQPSVDQLKLAFEKFEIDADVQIHLHSPLFYSYILNVDSIDVIGIETAKNPKAMDFIDVEEIESYSKKLRIGVARSDIDGIIAEFNSKHGVNAWGDPELILKAIDEIEGPEMIEKRLKNAVERFEDVLEYTGPDCGLFSFPSQEAAMKLLENTKKAIDSIRG
jgi:5-methyltetrahydropteroyltriglutamate--homocysteine methyltransferase